VADFFIDCTPLFTSKGNPTEKLAAKLLQQEQKNKASGALRNGVINITKFEKRGVKRERGEEPSLFG
jgi:hypothetical protein